MTNAQKEARNAKFRALQKAQVNDPATVVNYVKWLDKAGKK